MPRSMPLEVATTISTRNNTKSRAISSLRRGKVPASPKTPMRRAQRPLDARARLFPIRSASSGDKTTKRKKLRLGEKAEFVPVLSQSQACRGAVLSANLYGGGPPDDEFFRRRRWNQRRHLADHRQHQPLIPIGKRGAEAFDLRQKANLVLRKFAKHFLRFAVARSLSAREKIRERDIHGFRNLG